MTLREARCAFSYRLALLILHAKDLGYEVAFDEVTERITEKDPTSDHMKNSVHHQGLAADLLLYWRGTYLTQSEDYKELGLYWERMGMKLGLPFRWGGNWGDGNHFSFEWQGIK